MCCNHKQGLWVFLSIAAIFIGLSNFDFFISSFMQTLFDPNTWVLVAVVIAGSLIYRWSSREEKNHQYQ